MKKTVRTFTAVMLEKVIFIIKMRLAEIAAGEDVPRVKIAAGNSKLGHNIPAFNLPPLVTCDNCAACSRHCYAVKDYLSYRVKAVSTSHARNLVAIENNINLAAADIDKYLSKNKPAFFRIHSSGDFNVNAAGDSLAYARMWYEIARKHPGTRFLAFTKCYNIAAAIPFDTLDNFSLVLSEWADELTAPAELKKRYRTSRAVYEIADARENEIVCPGACDVCGMCWQLAEIGRNVAFEIH